MAVNNFLQLAQCARKKALCESKLNKLKKDLKKLEDLEIRFGKYTETFNTDCENRLNILNKVDNINTSIKAMQSYKNNMQSYITSEGLQRLKGLQNAVDKVRKKINSIENEIQKKEAELARTSAEIDTIQKRIASEGD